MTWLLVFCGLIICFGQPARTSCPVQLSPPSVAVRYGDPVSINCSTPVKDPEGMGWESPYGGTGLVLGATFLTWKVASLQDWEVSPKCFINIPAADDEEDEQCFEKASVIVYKMPDSVSISQPVQQGPVLEGLNSLMKCSVVGIAPRDNISVLWYKGEEIYYTETLNKQEKTPGNVTSVINVTVNRSDNGGHLSCAVKLNLGPFGPDLLAKSEPQEIVVFYPPEFTKPETETIDVTPRDEFVLNCTASANPPPKYSWESPSPSLEKVENEAVVTPSLQLPGTYNCTASNDYGSKTKLFIVNMKRGNRTTFAAIIGVAVTVGVLLIVAGVVLGTPEGTFSFSRGNYVRGRPSS